MIERGGKDSKKGQIKLSFGMIFSIILIAIFLAFAFFAIKKFLNISNTAQIAKFSDSIQDDIDRMWKGFQGEQEKEYILPGKIKYVCFADLSESARGINKKFYAGLNQIYYEKENMFFLPAGSAEGLDSKEVRHIDIKKITEDENPFCLKSIKGKLKLTLKKEYGEALVTITK